jgi:hypothetical protein
MRERDIQTGCSYEISEGKGKAVVTVIGTNPSGTWRCKRSNGNDVTVADPTRFLKRAKAPPGKPPKEAAKTKPEKPPASPKKAAKPKAGSKEAVADEGPQKAAKTAVSDTQMADPDTIARLTAAYKEASQRAKVARKAFDCKFIDQLELNDAEAELKVAKNSLLAAGGKPEKRGRCTGLMSAKEAAFRVLLEEKRPMRAREITDVAVDVKKYWSPEGATPEATLSSAIVTEIQRRGDKSRFVKVDKGLFTVRDEADE